MGVLSPSHLTCQSILTLQVEVTFHVYIFREICEHAWHRGAAVVRGCSSQKTETLELYPVCEC